MKFSATFFSRSSPQTASRTPKTPAIPAVNTLSARNWTTMRAAGGAERGPNRDLFATRGEAREQKIGHVRAGNQKHAPDRGEKRQEHRPLPADQVFMKGDDAHARLRIHFLGIRLLVAPVDDVKLLVGLLAAHAWFHAAKDGEIAGATLDDIGRQSFCLEDARQPDLILRERKFQRRRHDADDRERCAVEHDRLAEDVRVAAETVSARKCG